MKINDFILILSLVGFSSKVTVAQVVSGKERGQLLKVVESGLKRSLKAFDKKFAANKADISRELSYAAMAKMVTDAPESEAEKMLGLIFEHQNMNSGDIDYGNVPWQIGHPEINDKNAIEFTTQIWGPLLKVYGGSFSQPFTGLLVAHATAALTAITSHKVPVSYTNIYLMKTVNLILIGEAVGNQSAIDLGYLQLDEWVAYTRRAGIHEFDSPTYYGTDLNSLMNGYLFCSKPDGRKKFKAILDFFWFDIAANYFPSQQILSGAHSRDYDFIHDAGGINYYLFIEGMMDQQKIRKNIDLEYISLLMSLRSSDGYHPSPEIMKIAFSSPKTITQRWDTLAFYEHFNYITQDFSVGSAYGRYGQQDKLINISMASPKRLCDITVVGDITDEPYGKNKTPDKSGHQKPKHLPVIFNPVQENGSLMVLADCKLSGEKNANCIATNILLPGNADNIEINGQIVPISGITEIPFNLTDVLVIREGNTALFIKVFELEGYNNAQPQIVLIADSIGLKDSTIRLVLYHTREHIDKLKNVSLRAGILFSMDQYKKETDFSSALSRFSKTSILQTKDDHSWYAKAVVDKHTLEVQRENNSFKTIIRKIDGRGKISDPLTINGKSIQLSN